ncbi:MAG: DUF1311 domain-containing protein [Rhizobiaceae bacterium]|nr:DUF1311 domain-containing protein [Rhizobiaceae bacterium]
MSRLLHVCATLAAVAFLGTIPAQAQDCANAEDQATLNQCADQAYDQADKALNAAYRKVEQRLADAPDRRKQLVAAQRAWIAFRDAECGFRSSAVAGGSIEPMIYSGCLEDLTKVRTGQFDAYLACEEGDMSCPVPPAQ